MIQERDQVVGQRRDGQLVGIAQRTRLAMPAHVEAEQANARARAIDRERLVQVAAQAVLEHERQPLPFVAVVEIQAIAVENGHGPPRLISRADANRSYPSRDTPGTSSHYHPLLSTSPPLMVRRARRICGSDRRLEESGSTRRRTARWRRRREGWPVGAMAHPESTADPRAWSTGPSMSVSKTRTVFDVPSMNCMDIHPARGLERRVDAPHLGLRPNDHQVSRLARPRSWSCGTGELGRHLHEQGAVVGTVPGFVQVEPLVERLVAQLRQDRNPPAQQRLAVAIGERGSRKMLLGLGDTRGTPARSRRGCHRTACAGAHGP